ncbi:protein kinase domain-containing protein, partial [Yinghuangia sp. YIM S10712]|uniref:protein kinase domain-containing protein n=1 Tax=Yinghuangia sp. YIM S10712 TaxID=3436930 RepID=UPI003F530530
PRDLKPANVILAADGPRLIDFGIARALEGGTITRTGFLVGSPGFLAPEQAGSGQIGPATDVFALGSVLTYAATGTSPFGDGVFTELLFKVLYGEPDLGGVPERYRALVASMLVKDPDERPTPRRILEQLGVLGLEGDSGGAWLPQPLTDLVVAQSAALLSENPLGGESGGAGQAPAGTVPPEGRGAEPTELGAGAYAGLPPRPAAPGPYSQVTYGQSTYPPREFPVSERPPASGAAGSGTRKKRRRVVVAALAVAAIGIAAAVVVPGLLDDEKSGGDGQASNNGGASGLQTSAGATSGPPTATPDTACGAIGADFTKGTPRPEFSPANTMVTPTTSVNGYTITAGPGADARADFQGNVTAPFSSVPVNGDFAIETRVSVNPQRSYQSAGLLLFANKNSYIRLERGFGSFNSIAFEYFLNGAHYKLTTPFVNEPGDVVKTEADTVTLRLERRGDIVTAQWRAKDDALWEQLPGEAPFTSNGARAGMTVLNTPNSGQFHATFTSFTVSCL